jgi:hypothetical protein
MSAMPARITELSNGTQPGAVSTRTGRRAEGRRAQKLVRRDRRRWAVAGCCILAGSFGATVLVLGAFH